MMHLAEGPGGGAADMGSRAAGAAASHGGCTGRPGAVARSRTSGVAVAGEPLGLASNGLQSLLSSPAGERCAHSMAGHAEKRPQSGPNLLNGI